MFSSHSSKQQARAEQEEEFISNTLFKKIQALQKEKETLAVNYEKEEEFLTNELSRKLMQVNGLFDLPCPPHFLSLPLALLLLEKWLYRVFHFSSANVVFALVLRLKNAGVWALQTLEPTSGRQDEANEAPQDC